MTLPGVSPSFWIGTYETGGGAGVYPLTIADADLRIGLADDAAGNASFGVRSVRSGIQYLVDEQDDGTLGTYCRTPTGWLRMDRVSTHGAAPCHAALDATQSCLAIANYASGSIALYRLNLGGSPVEPPSVHGNTGRGPNAERQESAHAHWVGFGPDNDILYTTDLGTDEVLAFPFDATSGSLGTPSTAFAAPPGSGPRHMVFHAAHPQRAYLACELANTLVVLDVHGGGLRQRLVSSTLPENCDTHSIVAHIAANTIGDRLYVSNRGHDSITVFALDAHGDTTPIQHIRSGGVSPRFFLMIEDEHRMVVVHERDHRVTLLDIRPDGTLAPTDFGVIVPGAAFAFVD